VSPNITSSEGTIESLATRGELLPIVGAVDPNLEVAGIAKALDGGPCVLFENLTGFPGKRIVTNVFSRRSRFASLFGLEDERQMKKRFLDAVKNPIPAREVETGPSRANVIVEGIDVLGTIPVIKYTEHDPGRIMGGGIVLAMHPQIGVDLAFKRTHFQGRDWASMGLNMGSHLQHHSLEFAERKGKIPITLNVCCVPSILLVAASGYLPLLMPAGIDELAIAGALQGSPVEICSAKTVDAFALAQAEWVIEGYIDTSEVVWESEEAQKLGEVGKAPFFPEYAGYKGKAYRTFKFQATAVTHKDNPIYFAPLAHSQESTYLTGLAREAAVLDVCEKIAPGFVVDVNMLDAFKGHNGIVIQVRKRRRRDEGLQWNVIEAAFVASRFLRMVIVVDDDIDIYNAEEVFWAINSRVEPTRDLIINTGTRGDATSPIGRGGGTESLGISGKLGIDATIHLAQKAQYQRAEHPAVDLSQWLTDEQISAARSLQNDYSKILAMGRH